MKTDVLWDDMLWWLVSTGILWQCTACSFSMQQFWFCNIYEDMNLQFTDNKYCVRCSWKLFY